MVYISKPQGLLRRTDPRGSTAGICTYLTDIAASQFSSGEAQIRLGPQRHATIRRFPVPKCMG